MSSAFHVVDPGGCGCQTPRVRLADFWELARAEFGPGYAASLVDQHVIGSLEGRTARAALDDGVAPRLVWSALCDDFDVPAERRLGPLHRRPGGPRSGR